MVPSQSLGKGKMRSCLMDREFHFARGKSSGDGWDSTINRLSGTELYT